ncbi:MAG TPA: cbb3-type cytochrome c oxidase subunit 3 [Alphaproteobacteria bacterium]|nr:cbb3-type cytochrome c oxidase subunit 3 [Alphaproteobacteria bacterium]
MDSATYDSLRHFADSWGLLYMFGIFIVVAIMLFLPGARRSAAEAARIPFNDDDHSAARGSRK